MIKWEYRIEKFIMPADWLDNHSIQAKWHKLADTHWTEMNKLGLEGWEYMMTIGPLFYFKRPKEGI